MYGERATPLSLQGVICAMACFFVCSLWCQKKGIAQPDSHNVSREGAQIVSAVPHINLDY